MNKLILAALLLTFGCARPAKHAEVFHNWVAVPDDMIVDFKVSPGWHNGREYDIKQHLRANKVEKSGPLSEGR